MNAQTKNYLENLENFQMFYSSNKEELDNVKCFAAMIPLLSEMLETCNQEFVRSISYINEYKQEKDRKRQEIEIIANRIKMAIQDYCSDNNINACWDDKAIFGVSTLNLSNEGLLQFFTRLNQIVEPIQSKLLQYGITSNLLREFNRKVLDIIPAMPINLDEIEMHKRRYYSVQKTIDEIVKYLSFR